MITIGNPIFDSVFKFFLADDTAARILLSALLKKKVTKLETRKNEFLQKGSSGELSVMRIDFAAHVLTNKPDGTEVDELIIIELQKAWVNYEIPRFRRYLGLNYMASENIFVASDDNRKYGLPIIAVYILNHRVGQLTEPITYLNRQYQDYNGKPLTVGVPDKFGESLSHDCIIVQVPLLGKKIRNRAEKILQIFNQKFIVTKKERMKMAVSEVLIDGDAEMQCVVNRLSMVFADEYTTELMIAENQEYEEYTEYLAQLSMQSDELKERAKKIEEQSKTIEENAKTIEENAKTIEENAKTIEEKTKTIEEQSKAIEEQSKAIEEKDKELEKLRLLLKQHGLSDIEL